MTRRRLAFLLMIVGVVGFLAVASAPAAASPSLNESALQDGISVNVSDLEAGLEIDLQTPDSTDQVTTFDASPDSEGDDAQRIVVETTNLTDDRTTVLEDHGEIQATYEGQVELELPAEAPGAVETIDEKEWVDRIREPSYAIAGTTSEGVEVIDADEIHAEGITGDDVAVGIIDPTGFDVDNEEITDNVAATYQDNVSNGGNNDHGTATAEVVTDVAPDTDLYLARGSTDVEYGSAVNWLVASDVDVIVMSASFYGQPNDGTGLISTIADDAVENHDIVWVNSAGNNRGRHYTETFTDRENDGWHEYEEGTNVNPLNDGEPLLIGQSARVFLTWNDWPNTSDHYDLVLVRYNDGEWTPVTTSSTSQFSNDPREDLKFTAHTTDIYAIAIANAGTTANHDIQLFVDSATQGPVFTTPESSISAPATGHHTMSVAAVNTYDNTLASYSSRGPTLDGRAGVDVAAPTGVSTTAYDGSYAGTSAAAPHVGGLAALVQSADSSLDAEETADRIRAGADASSIDFSRVDEPQTSSELEYDVGQGMVDAEETVESPGPRVEISSINSPTSVVTGESFSIDVAVKNTGTEHAIQEISGSFMNDTDSTIVSLSEGETKRVTFTLSTGDRTGTHDLVIETKDDATTIEQTVVDEETADLPVEEGVYNTVARLSGTDDTRVTGADIVQFRGVLLDGERVIDGVEVTGADLVQLRGYLLR